MTTITGPDGNDYEFPESMSDDDIKGVMRKKFGGDSAPAAPPMEPPSFMSRLMGSLSAPFQGAGQAIGDYGRVAANAVTLNQADNLIGKLTGQDERKLTDESRARLGLMAPITDAASFAMGPVGAIGMAAKGAKAAAPYVGKTLAGILGSGAEGAAVGGASALGHGDDPVTGAVTGGAVGSAAVPVASAVGSILKRVVPSLPSTANLEDAANNIWDRFKGFGYKKQDVQAISRRAWSDALAGGQPMTEIGNPKAWKLLSNFSEEAIRPIGTPFTIKDLRDWQDKAQKLTGDDLDYGNMLHSRIEDLINQGTPILPKGATTGDVTKTIGEARHADKLTEVNKMLDNAQQDYTMRGPDPKSTVGNYLRANKTDLPEDMFDALNRVQRGSSSGGAADYLAGHATRIAHGMAWPLAVGLGATGHIAPAALALTGGLVGAPVINKIGTAIGDSLTNSSIDTARRAISGTGMPHPDPEVSEALRRLLLGLSQ